VQASGEVLAEDVNTEITDNDITAHPELKLARWAAERASERISARARGAMQGSGLQAGKRLVG
jgi:tRNA(Arg) A34 adenosine deaminase TadA